MTGELYQRQYDAQGRPHGVCSRYGETGAIRWRHHYQHGKRYGLSEYFFSCGTPYKKTYYLRIK
jgi:antitoxin component YwqK of YwqJK toxin-antitoxin module